MSDRHRRVHAATLPEGYQFGEGSRDEDAYEEAVRQWYESCRVVFPRPVVMCGCGDWLTCEHPWPQLFPEMRPLSDEEFREKYIRPAVEHDPQGAADLIERWRAPHENAAAQLKRREMVDGATLAPGDRPFITIGPDCQRTGDETV